MENTKIINDTSNTEAPKLAKFKMHKFGKDCYLLGIDKDGTKYFLEAATWECNWYWGGGYVETYINNTHPERSRDISSHQHFDGLFFNNPRKMSYDAFKEFFAETPFTDKEIWKILELMKSFYIVGEYSDMLHMGGAHYTANPIADIIKNDEEYKRINEAVIPRIMQELYTILGE